MNNDKEKILGVLSGVLKRGTAELSGIGDSSDLREIGLDSVTSIDVIVNMENAFNITVDDEDLLIENFNTVEKLIRLLDKCKSNIN